MSKKKIKNNKLNYDPSLRYAKLSIISYVLIYISFILSFIYDNSFMRELFYESLPFEGKNYFGTLSLIIAIIIQIYLRVKEFSYWLWRRNLSKSSKNLMDISYIVLIILFVASFF